MTMGKKRSSKKVYRRIECFNNFLNSNPFDCSTLTKIFTNEERQKIIDTYAYAAFKAGYNTGYKDKKRESENG